MEHQDGFLAAELVMAHSRLDVLGRVLETCRLLVHSYRSGFHEAVIMVGHQTVKAFIIRDESVKYGVFMDFSTFVEGYGEGFWVFFVL